MRINKHDSFIIFCLNTCSELISKMHVCVHGSRVWCNHLFTYSRYHFSSCQWEQSKNIPRCGLGLLRICSRNSRQEEVALTNALIWKRAANTPPPNHPPTPSFVWQETPLLHWFLLGFTDSLQTLFLSLSPIPSISFSHFSPFVSYDLTSFPSTSLRFLFFQSLSHPL